MMSSKAQKLINDYLNLPFPGVEGVRCPYFNNAKVRARGQLRVLVGKGTPQEIVEESKIVSLQYHAGFFDHDGHCCLHDGHGEKTGAEEMRKFLIDHNLGIDCSGFATFVLRAHFLETKGMDIAKKIVKNIPAPWWRKIIMNLRPIESIGVQSGYYNDKNTEKLGSEQTGYDYSKLLPGDCVVMLETGPNNKRNHIIVITDCDGQKIKYAHSRAWSSEGQYGHGVNTGEIKITNPGRGLLEQEWTEKIPPQQESLFHAPEQTTALGNETFWKRKMPES